MDALKTIKKLVAEGYKLKAHHNNNDWKKALEEGEILISKISQEKKPEKVKSCCCCDNLPEGEIAISSKALSDPNWTDNKLK